MKAMLEDMKRRNRLIHERVEKDDVRGFYSQLTGDVIVDLEASRYSTWFIELLESLGHQIWLSDATEIRRRARRRQKNDRRDAELILDLMLKGEFPPVHRTSFESREILRLLRYRHRLVQMRTQMKNSLQVLAREHRLDETSDVAQSKGS
jgi:transposase